MKVLASVKFRFDFRKTLSFISKNTMSKVVLKYQFSMLPCPSVHPTYPKIHFRITRTLNPLSQLYIDRKFQKYISVSISPCHRASFMRSPFIAFKNDEWCHLVVCIGSVPLISFYCVCVSFLSISLFFLTFLWSPLLAEVWRSV